MNNEKKPIKLAIKTFYEDESLSDIQLQSLQALQNTLQQSLEKFQGNIHSTKPRTLQWLGAIAASLLLFIIVFGYAYTPEVITAAYVDIKKDAAINNGLQTSVNQWMSENNIYKVPQEYPVEMSKRCKLEQYQTTHLRIAGAEQGMMHVFFHQGDPDRWFKRTGTVGEMSWKSIRVRNDLTVLVLYTKDMRESAMQNILGGMFPELQA